MMRLKVDKLTILIGLKEIKQIETYLCFPVLHGSGDRQFSRIKKGNLYNGDFAAVLVNTTVPGL